MISDPYSKIENCSASKLPFLDLSYCRLENQDFEEGSKFFKAFIKCNHISNLNLSSNKLSKIKCLDNLVNLSHLDISHNSIFDISTVNFLKNIKELNLSDNLLKEIINFKLPKLEKLNLDSNLLTGLPNLTNLINLKSLSIKNNKINHLSNLAVLVSLEKLCLSSNKIEDTLDLSHLKNLQYADLNNNSIETILFSEKASNLKYLDLKNNRISKVAFLKYCSKLLELHLDYNDLLSLEGIENSEILEKLSASNNNIISINGIEKLTRLLHLNLSNNEIKNTSNLENLTNLSSLNLSRNKIMSIIFNKLQYLEDLDLSFNNLKDIEDQKFNSHISRINFSNNEITSIGFLLPLLERKDSPINIQSEPDIVNNGFINIYNNPLNNPPQEVIAQGKSAIINYFLEIEKQGIEYLYEAKMLILGQPRAGKTTLRYKLFDINKELPNEDKTTRGIDVERLDFNLTDRNGKLRTFYYNVWDFGGQQIYQTTHQFFLTHRSLYILVLDSANDNLGNDDSSINYWLQTSELLGGNSPLFLVCNEKNGRHINIDSPQKKARFPFIKNEYFLDFNALIESSSSFSYQRLLDFKNFKEDIERELRRLPLVGFPMPKNWIKIKNELEIISKQKEYITRQDYSVLCRKYEVIDFEKQMELSRIFHDLGVFLHFQNYSNLEDFIILQNVWATDSVFAVLDDKTIIANFGKFTDENLAELWETKGYKKEIHKKLLSLMMQFELCYKIMDDNKTFYIIPEMLPNTPPPNYKWEEENDISLQYHYDFMPKGILTRFIVRLHKYIAYEDKSQFVWKSGVMIKGDILGCPNSSAEIIEAWNNKQLFIRAQGKFSKELMNKITFEIDLLNNDYFKRIPSNDYNRQSSWYKMIPCNCSTCSKSSIKYYYDYNKLIERKGFGKTTIECDKKPYESVSINRLFEGVFASTIETSTIKKIFISYARNDEKWKNKLVTNLAVLRKQGLIFDWNDRMIEADIWERQIEEVMKKSDIFLLLITQNFLSSSYITSKEIIMAFTLYKHNKAIIFPVICDSCDWELLPITLDEKEEHKGLKKEIHPWLGKFQAFPQNAKPIKNWKNQQDAFVDVINQLKKYL